MPTIRDLNAEHGNLHDYNILDEPMLRDLLWWLHDPFEPGRYRLVFAIDHHHCDVYAVYTMGMEDLITGHTDDSEAVFIVPGDTEIMRRL